MTFPETITSVAEEIAERRGTALRFLVAIAGPPATGKSTFAAALADALNEIGQAAVVVPMDGFHLDNIHLHRLGRIDRKGAPDTFDFEGFQALLLRLRATDRSIYFPLFDRASDRSFAGAGAVLPNHAVILVEGNYLLLDEDPWSGLSKLFDFRLFIDTRLETLAERLAARWIDHGLTPEAALDRARRNDLPNAERVLAKFSKADRTLGP